MMENEILNEVSRSKVQELIVQLMYSFLILEQTNIPINFEESVEDACKLPYADCDLYLKEVLIKSLKNKQKVVDYVSQFLKNWTFNRLNTTIQAILITSVVEYFLDDLDTDKAVIINNAVKFAKKFGDGGEKDYKFVNAILDKCLNGKGNSLLLD